MSSPPVSSSPTPSPTPSPPPSSGVPSSVQTSFSVIVSNISPEANEKVVSDFFSFCGNITKLTLQRRGKEKGNQAIVTFDNEAAAKTALLLTNALIADRPITVVTATGPETQNVSYSLNSSNQTPSPSSSFYNETVLEGDQIRNRAHAVPADERSKTSVIASMIAAGYVIGADALRKAKELDEQRKITQTVQNTAENIGAKLRELDAKLNITKTLESFTDQIALKTREVDKEFHISETATTFGKNIGDSITGGVDSIQQKVSQNQTFKSAMDSLSTFGDEIGNLLAPATNTIKNEFDLISSQSKQLIEVKKREMGLLDQEDFQASSLPTPLIPSSTTTPSTSESNPTPYSSATSMSLGSSTTPSYDLTAPLVPTSVQPKILE